MEMTMQSSFPNIRSKIALIEAIELAGLGFAFWCLGAFVDIRGGASLSDQIFYLIFTEGILLGSWALYTIYMRVARAGGKIVDIGIWLAAAAVTGSYTFWAWSILDINRLIISKLLYRGEAPVELAWSWRSKQAHKAWEKARKAEYV